MRAIAAEEDAVSSTEADESTSSAQVPTTCNEDDEEEAVDDEAEQAEADEFYSQLIEWPPAKPGADGDEDEENVPRYGNPSNRNRKNRLRWHPDESDFFRKCARLFDTNYVMIKEFLPHRSVADLKKQYDKQRTLYPSLFASFSTTPRFQTVDEYHQLKDDLEEEKMAFEERMSSMGIRPWVNSTPDLPVETPRSPSQTLSVSRPP